MEEFIKIREIWENYIENDRKCLKTLDDFNGFASYTEEKLSLTDENGRFLHRKDGAIKRLIMEFCRAWRHRKAGTHEVKPHIRNDIQIFPDYRLRHKMIVEILGEAGLPCKVSDVDNARNKEFEPFRVPNTERTRHALLMLKDRYFPLLEIDQFLARPSELSIKSVVLSKCPYGRKMMEASAWGKYEVYLKTFGIDLWYYRR